jgi:hypothetical protein
LRLLRHVLSTWKVHDKLARGKRVQLFTWFEDGATPSRFYPWMTMSAVSAAAFDGFIDRIGAVITGRRT